MVARGHHVTTAAAGEEPSVVRALADMGIDYRPLPLSRAGLSPVADLRGAGRDLATLP